MSKLYNNSGILGCKNPQKAGNSPQKDGKMVLPAQACENLENPTCGTQLATPFAAVEQCAAGVKLDNTAVEQGAAVEKLDNGVLTQSAACGKFGKGVELGIAERCYVAGDETGSTLSGHSTKTQQILANTHKCFVQKANNNTNTACGTAKKQAAGVNFGHDVARKSRAHAGDKLACNNCGNTLVRARAAGVKLDNGTVEQGHASVKLDTAAHKQCAAGGKFGKKHSKVLRAVACGCLAILMCGTAFLGTACGSAPANVGLNGGGAGGSAAAVGAGVNYGNGTTGNAGQGSAASAEQNFATQGGGLITPRADDPVLFETKDGVQIKFGLNGVRLQSGALSGFLYFTTVANNVTYSWVIIGENTLYGNTLWAEDLNYYYGQNCFETETPAGIAIMRNMTCLYPVQYNGSLGNFSLISVVNNSEIPANCVLCMLNDPVGEVRRTNAGGWCAGEIVDLETVADAHCSISELGLTSIQSQIRTMTLVTRSWDASYRNDPVRIFSFGCEPNSSFKYNSYLTQSQLAISTSDKTVLRDGYSDYRNAYLTPQGTHSIEPGGYNVYKVRPLFVMSVV